MYSWGFPLCLSRSRESVATDDSLGGISSVGANFLQTFGKKLSAWLLLAVVTALVLIAPSAGAQSPSGVCGRTPVVRDALVEAVSRVTRCEVVGSSDLQGIQSLDLSGSSIGSLKAGDFSGLSGLRTLDLSDNMLTSISLTAFSSLVSLETLRLNGNQLNSFSSNALSSNRVLNELTLNDNPGTPFDLPLLIRRSGARFDSNSSPATMVVLSPVGGRRDSVSPVVGALQLDLAVNRGELSHTSAGTNQPFQVRRLGKLDTTLTVSLQTSVDRRSSMGYRIVAPDPVTLFTIDNRAFSGTVSITGTPTAGNLQTAVLNNFADADGLPSTYQYQWHRGSTSTFTSDETNAIPGAVGASYPATNADMGSYLRVVVSFTDGGGTPERVVSSATSATITAATGICDRTDIVQTRILAATSGISACADITSSHLTAIQSLDLSNQGIEVIREVDFSGLTGLTSLNLSTDSSLSNPNLIRVLDGAFFSDLGSLQTLNVANNLVTSPPDDTFNALTALTSLDLSSNRITSLPEIILSRLGKLASLNVSNNQLTSVPTLLEGSSALTALDLSGNQLTSLPENFFNGVGILSSLNLLQSGLRPPLLPIQLSFVRNRSARDAASPATVQVRSPVAATETLNVSVSNGTIVGSSADTNTVAVALNTDFMVNRLGQVSAKLTGEFPSLVEYANDGYRLIAPEPLTIFPNTNRVSLLPATISGINQEGQRLTVDTSPIQDPDGNPNPFVATYQWQRSADEVFTNPGVISGVTGATYTLTDTDIGRYIRVIVSFTDALGSPETSIARLADPVVAAGVGICGRTPAVYNAIVTALSVSNCIAVTPDLLRSVTTLTLSNNAVTELDAGDFSGLSGLTSLDLSGNDSSLSVLPTGLFAGLSSLETLNLSGNEALRALEEDLFDGLDSLQTLDLSGNTGLSSLEEDLFDGLRSLQTLDLSGNTGLSSLPGTLFSNLNAPGERNPLEVLKLNGIGLTAVHEDLLAGLTALRELRLNNNALATIPDNLFRAQTSLTTLDLSGNTGAPFTIKLRLMRTDGEDPESVARSSGSIGIVAFLQVRSPLAMLQPVIVTADNGATIRPQDLAVGPTTNSDLRITRRGLLNSTITASLPTSFSNAPYVPFGYSLTDPDSLTIFTNENSLPRGEVTFTGTLRVGQELTVNRTQLEDDDGLPTSSNFSYAWQRSADEAFTTPISISATGDTYTLDGADLNHYIRVVLSFVDGEGTPETFTSVVTAVVQVAEAGICERTVAVRAAILAAITPSTDCRSVTAEQLALIDTLIVTDRGLTLSADDPNDPNDSGDLDGLTGLTDLNLRGNNLGDIPAGVFDDLTSLRLLNLANSRVSSLPARVFENLTNLEHLNLSGNTPLGSLEAGVFTGLGSLQILNLSENRGLSSLADHLFSDLTELTSLNLSRNPTLTTLSTAVFSGLGDLETLDLNASGLTGLPEGVFDGLSSLTVLDISSNSISGNLPPELFSKLAGLMTLDLSSNPGAPFGIRLVIQRVDGSGAMVDALTAGPTATLQVRSPFAATHRVNLQVDTGILSTSVADTNTSVFLTQQGRRSSTVSATLAVTPIANAVYGYVLVNPEPVRVFPNTNAAPSGSPVIDGNAIDGAANVGEQLTAVTSSITDTDVVGTIEYQWQRSSEADFSSEVEGIGTSNAPYTILSTDAGYYIRLRVSYIDGNNSMESLLSNILTVNTPATGLPTIMPTSNGALLNIGVEVTAITDDGDDAITDANGPANNAIVFTYQWQRSSEASFSSAVSDIGTGSGRYTIVPDDAGKYLRVIVSFTDQLGFTESLTSASVGPVNTLATGAPSIVGDPKVGVNLTVGTDTIMDANGRTADFRYQWYRGQSSGFTADARTLLAGVISDNYDLTSGDVGRYLKVRVSFRDDQGFEEVLFSEAAGPVTLSSEGSVSISGVARSGESLTATPSIVVPGGGGSLPVTLRYQWQRSDAVGFGPSDNTDNIGSDQDNYDLVSNDAGQFIRVMLTYTIQGSSPETVTSAVFGPINTPPTGELTISGMAEVGKTLTAVTSAIKDVDGQPSTFSYRWERSDDTSFSGTPVVITGAITNAYRLMDADMGKYLRVVVSYAEGTDYAEMLTSGATAAIVARSNNLPIGAPRIAGTPNVGQTLTALRGSIMDNDGIPTDPSSGNPIFTYQWQRSADDTFSGDPNIPSATSVAYLLQVADMDQYLRVVVSFTDGAGNPESLESPSRQIGGALNNDATGVPGITGLLLQSGQMLTATKGSIQDLDGIPTDPISGNPIFTYQWQRLSVSDGNSVRVGSDSPTYTLTDADVGSRIFVIVSFTDERNFVEEGLASQATGVIGSRPPNNLATGVLTLPVTAAVGDDLTVDTGSIRDNDGIPTDNVGSPMFSYQWQRSTDEGFTTPIGISGATAATYTLVAPQDVGHFIRVVVSFTDGRGFAEELFSSATKLNSPATGDPVIRGNVRVGQELMADTSAIADADGLGAFSYQWQISANSGFADGTIFNIGGATAPTYRLIDLDLNNYIRVMVSFTDSRGFSEILTSAASAAVGERLPNTPATGRISITGTLSAGSTLVADTSDIADADGRDANGFGAFSYQWYRGASANFDLSGNQIPDAQGRTYSLTSADVDSHIAVTVTFIDRRGYFEGVDPAYVGPIMRVMAAQVSQVVAAATDLATTAVFVESLGTHLGNLSSGVRIDGRLPGDRLKGIMRSLLPSGDPQGQCSREGAYQDPWSASAQASRTASDPCASMNFEELVDRLRTSAEVEDISWYAGGEGQSNEIWLHVTSFDVSGAPLIGGTPFNYDGDGVMGYLGIGLGGTDTLKYGLTLGYSDTDLSLSIAGGSALNDSLARSLAFATFYVNFMDYDGNPIFRVLMGSGQGDAEYRVASGGGDALTGLADAEVLFYNLALSKSLRLGDQLDITPRIQISGAESSTGAAMLRNSSGAQQMVVNSSDSSASEIKADFSLGYRFDSGRVTAGYGLRSGGGDLDYGSAQDITVGYQGTRFSLQASQQVDSGIHERNSFSFEYVVVEPAQDAASRNRLGFKIGMDHAQTNSFGTDANNHSQDSNYFGRLEYGFGRLGKAGVGSFSSILRLDQAGQPSAQMDFNLKF